MKTPNTRLAVAALLALALAAAAAGPAAADPREDSRADRALAEARAALNSERYQEAARLFAEAFAKAQEKELAGDALYWEAFARYRLQQTGELKRALELLKAQQLEFRAAATAVDGQALAARIAGELAARGEAGAAREIYEAADADHQKEQTRIAALHALMRMDPDKARPMLERIIRGETDATPELRQNAVFILCQQDDQGVDIVIDALATATDPQLLQAMALCLARDESERSLDALAALLRRTDDREVKQAALVAIGRRDSGRSFDLLAAIVRDPQWDPDLRAHAMLGLSRTDDDRVVDLALAIVNGKDEPEDLLEMALMTLARNDSPRAADALLAVAENADGDAEVRAMALYNAGVHGTLDVARLRRIYETTDNRELKLQVCHVLARLDDEDAALDLMLDIVRTEPDPEIRQGAVFWLGQFDDPRAAEALVEIIGGQ